MTVVAQATPSAAVPQVRAVDRGGAVGIATDRPDLVEVLTIEGASAEPAGPGDDDAYALPGAMQAAIRTWAQGWAERAGLPGVRPAPSVWCSWYQYWTEVAEPAVLAEAEALAAAELPVEVVQIDDGWQQEIGDWVERADRFGSLAATAGRLRGLGFRTGLWTAPFFAGGQSALAREHPEWLVRGDDGEPLVVAEHWLQPLYALDATHPAAADHLRALFGGFAAAGIDYHKVDFVFAGAVEGRRHADVDGVTAYREGLRLIRDGDRPGGLPARLRGAAAGQRRPGRRHAGRPRRQPGMGAVRGGLGAARRARRPGDHPGAAVVGQVVGGRPRLPARPAVDGAPRRLGRLRRAGGAKRRPGQPQRLDRRPGRRGDGLVPRPPGARRGRDSVRSLM